MTTRGTQVYRRSIVSGEPNVRATQTFRRALMSISPAQRVTQVFRRAIVRGFPCIAETCQIWKITRRDGEVFRYTSHSEDIEWAGYTWRACLSFQSSATQSAAEIGSAGDFTLEGIVSDDGVSEEDLFGGLFDDAFVECWRIDWGGTWSSPRRLFAGWVGDVSHGADGVKMSVLGPSHRLSQNAITTVIAPACRWVFGSPECGYDREAIKLTGTVMTPIDRGAIQVALSGDDGGWYWAGGLLRVLTGANAGQELEVKEVEFASTGTGTGSSSGSGASVIVLWKLAAKMFSPGDTFELLPGCDKAKDSDTGCQLYNNKINHGGFPDVPGEDALTDSPSAKY